MEYCLIEKCIPGIQLPNNCKAVALTPEAVAWLQNDNIDFITLEAFYTSAEIRGDEEGYTQDQIQWFEQFDGYIQSVYPYAKRQNLKLASVFHVNFKYLVDDIILCSRMLKNFIESTKPTKLWVSPNYLNKKILLGHNIIPVNASVLSKAVRYACRHFNIDYEELDYTDRGEKLRVGIEKYVNEVGVSRVSFKKRVAKIMPAQFVSFVMDLRKQGNYFKIWQTMSNCSIKRGKILFVQYDNAIHEFCVDLKKAGFNVLLKEGNKIKGFGDPPWVSQGNLEFNNEHDVDSIEVISDKELNLFLKGPITQWINEQCAGADYRELMDEFFSVFLREYCPLMMRKVENYIQFFDKHEIDYIAAHMYTLAELNVKGDKVVSLDVYAMLAAVDSTNKTKSIGVSHGVDVYENKSRFFQLTYQFDIYLFASKAEVESEEAFKRLFNCEKPMLAYTHYLRKARIKTMSTVKPYDWQILRKNNSKNKPVVLFCPIMMSPFPNRPIQKTQSFPMEYMKWHFALLQYMSKHGDYFFVWKGFFANGQRIDIIQNKIIQRCYSNIFYSTNKLVNFLPFVDKVICDIPSTAFFEANFIGKPVISFYQKSYQNIRQNALATFGDSIQESNSIEEGLAIVEKFLSLPSQKYQNFHDEDRFDVAAFLLKQLRSNNKSVL